MKLSSTLTGWYWRKVGDNAWTRCKHDRPATQIHVDLVDAGIIKDPLLGLNERDVQWIGETDWEYKVHFDHTGTDGHSAESQHRSKCLRFESLDTLATVFLNDTKILESDNMFHIHDVDVTDTVKHGDNELRIVFKSALLHARALNEKWGKVSCWNGETARMFVRKAQYQFGWDWGPCLISCGPCKPVHFDTYDVAIKDVFVSADVNENLDAIVRVQVATSESPESSVAVELLLNGQTVDIKKTQAGHSTVEFHLKRPELWWPHRYGPAPLYTVRVKALAADGKRELDSRTTQFGIRRAKLVQRPLADQPGKTFFFEINNVPIFCVGSNWIPGHSFTSLLTEADYLSWIEMAVNGNQDMLRIWAGGYYEDDALLAECDRQGVLVWHDFLFGCGQYPCDDAIEASVKREAEDQLRRLRNYCSIVIWAGNNEDYQLAESCNLTWDKDDLSGNYNDTNFPARTLYEKTLPDAVKKMCPSVAYHPGSPWGGKTTRDQTEGDIHQWDVWHGSQEPYQDWPKLGGRFVSEFGMQGMPHAKTVDHFLAGEATERYPQSETVEFHNKADSWERRLALYAMENIKLSSMKMDDWIYATQLLQSECLAYAYRSWRRDWKGPGREYNAGALVWQLNDCWACTSWAIVDFFRRPKLAYYALKREGRDVVVGVARSKSRDSPNKMDLAVWGVNATLQAVKAVLSITVFDIDSGLSLFSEKHDVDLRPNQSTELLERMKLDNAAPCAILATLTAKDTSETLARFVDWPQPLKHIHFSKRNLSVSVDSAADCVVVRADKPIKGVELLPGDSDGEIILDDNGFDICPGEVLSIKVKGLSKGSKIGHRFYCDSY